MRVYQSLFIFLLLAFEIVHSLPAMQAADTNNVTYPRAVTVPKVKTKPQLATTKKKPTTKSPAKGKTAVPPVTAKNAKSCKLKSPTAPKGGKTTVKMKTREFFDSLTSLLKREQSGPEFIGYHGTNGANAQHYLEVGRKAKKIPVPAKFNGADGELSGLGIYVADDIYTAATFATGSAGSRNAAGIKENQANVPFVCLVEANSQTTWREKVMKVWIPFTQVARLSGGVNNPEKLKEQEDTIKCAGGDPKTAVRFSVLEPNNAKIGNQMMIPQAEFANVRISNCAQVNPTQLSRLAKDFGEKTFPEFNYFNLRGAWKIHGNVR